MIKYVGNRTEWHQARFVVWIEAHDRLKVFAWRKDAHQPVILMSRSRQVAQDDGVAHSKSARCERHTVQQFWQVGLGTGIAPRVMRDDI